LILPDVNVLVHAFRREAPEHARYAEWLAGVVAGSELGLTETMVTGVVRVVLRETGPGAGIRLVGVLYHIGNDHPRTNTLYRVG